MNKWIVTVTLVLLCVAGCSKPEQEESMPKPKQSHPVVEKVQQKYAPDRRTAIFTVAVIEKEGETILKGEVDNADAKEELLAEFRRKDDSAVDSIVVLPAENIGEKSWGIITVSAANMRTDPSESAELGSQTLMGNIVRIWKKKGGYVYIQSPDRYLGWTDADQLHRVTEKEANEWNSAKKMFLIALYDMVREKPDESSFPVCDLAGGAVLKYVGESGSWVKVGLADGRTGFVQKKNLIEYSEWGTKLRPVPDNIERTGRFLMGVPYLWGGTSAKGVDCSGFTKTVYNLNGLLLNRDANQQADQGTHVEPGEKFEHLKKGDLLFFGRKEGEGKKERITHVGIYLGNREYIHSSGTVHINSFDPDSPIFNEYNLNRFVRARRVIPSVPEVAEVKSN